MNTQTTCNGEREQKREQKGSEPGGFTVARFRVLLFYFSISPELQVGPRSFRFPTLLVLLIEKGEKNRAKNEENGEKGGKKANCEQLLFDARGASTYTCSS
jgi:hypothetical protein